MKTFSEHLNEKVIALEEANATQSMEVAIKSYKQTVSLLQQIVKDVGRAGHSAEAIDVMKIVRKLTAMEEMLHNSKDAINNLK